MSRLEHLFDKLDSTKFYLRDETRRRVVTIRYRPMARWPRPEGGYLYAVQYAVSTWNYKDQYSRVVGDADCTRKLEEERSLNVVCVDENEDPRQLVLRSILANKNIPHRARHLAGVRIVEEALEAYYKWLKGWWEWSNSRPSNFSDAPPSTFGRTPERIVE